MDEKAAWENFQRTGSVIDYLEYRAVKQGHDAAPKQEDGNADRYRWPDHQGTEYR